jgi:hypothetical protein
MVERHLHMRVADSDYDPLGTSRIHVPERNKQSTKGYDVQTRLPKRTSASSEWRPGTISKEIKPQDGDGFTRQPCH